MRYEEKYMSKFLTRDELFEAVRQGDIRQEQADKRLAELLAAQAAQGKTPYVGPRP